MKVKLLGYRVLIKQLPLEEIMGAGGIIMPMTGNPLQGIVVTVGDGELENAKEQLAPETVKPGDRVLYWPNETTQVVFDGVQYQLTHLSKVIGVILEGEAHVDEGVKSDKV